MYSLDMVSDRNVLGTCRIRPCHLSHIQRTIGSKRASVTIPSCSTLKTRAARPAALASEYRACTAARSPPPSKAPALSFPPTTCPPTTRWFPQQQSPRCELVIDRVCTHTKNGAPVSGCLANLPWLPTAHLRARANDKYHEHTRPYQALHIAFHPVVANTGGRLHQKHDCWRSGCPAFFFQLLNLRISCSFFEGSLARDAACSAKER